MAERLILALALLAVGFLLFRGYVALQKRRATRAAAVEPALADVGRTVPTIVYFTTPTCVACKAAQTPALQSLQNDLGDGLRVVTIDAVEQPDVASRWGVFTAPTTFVLSARGDTIAVNYGTADAATLRRQYDSAFHAAAGKTA